MLNDSSSGAETNGHAADYSVPGVSGSGDSNALDLTVLGLNSGTSMVS